MKSSDISIHRFFILSVFAVLVLAGCTGAKDDTGAGNNNSSTTTVGSTACLTDSNVLNTVSFIDSIGDAAQGGKLYDKWWAAVNNGQEPSSDHPLWSEQSNNTRSGADTWRCKECHGWDYQGVNGVYGDISNSHYTGFPGIMSATTKEPVEVFCAIRSASDIDARHDFSGKLDDIQILHLTKFITASQSESAGTLTPTGVIDVPSYINMNGSLLNANAGNGELLYGNIPEVGCSGSSCHGTDGMGQHEPIGSLASGNPWETLHKIRFGHPGSGMPAYSSLTSGATITLQESLDIIAYAQQSLPKPDETDACLTDPTVQSLVNQISIADAAQGGRLYDKWWSAINSNAPTGDHPLWSQQSTNIRTGADTWRCKECHGWDYSGVDGIYGDTSNSHYTGFPGILAATTKEPIEVFCAIRSASRIDSNHNFSAQLPDFQILNLTKFITASQDETANESTPRGIIDVASHINNQGTISSANTSNGQTQYESASIGCSSSSCHGIDGTAQPEAVGSLASDNPWETLHKIRFGHPGSIMPAYSSTTSGPSLTLQSSLDIVGYAQVSLPKPQADTGCVSEFGTFVSGSIGFANAARGGQLYDKWWVAAGVTQPTTDHPLWSTQSTNTRTGADTWRCKECHGWDYRGVDGVYGDSSNSHFTGFAGVFNAQSNQPIDVFCAIYSSTGITGDHSFSSQLDRESVLDLAKFVIDGGVINTGSYIDNNGSIIGGNSTNGATFYSSANGCSASNCHGVDGAAQAEPLGVLSVGNPWEVMHKVRFGHPGAIMPAYGDPNSTPQLNLTQIADVIAYTQTLGGTSGGGGGGTPALTELQMIARGGRLYDNWISETGADVPPIDNPVWALQSTNPRSGADTWRCKECHGWDYKGVNGIYGRPASSHYTGFGGVYGTEKTEANIVEYLTNGFFHAPTQTTVHRFGGLIDPADIEALAKFVKQGTIDVSIYFGFDGIINGSEQDFLNGQDLYSFKGFGVINGNCSWCHDPNGKRIIGVILGAVANDNPWEFLHKVRFGQPNSEMPSLVDQVDPLSGVPVFDTQDAVDITHFSQSLPTQ